MSEIKEGDLDSNNPKKEPLFKRRENGVGWDLNISSPMSYVILAIILAFPFAVVIYCMFLIKK